MGRMLRTKVITEGAAWGPLTFSRITYDRSTHYFRVFFSGDACNSMIRGLFLLPFKGRIFRLREARFTAAKRESLRLPKTAAILQRIA
jgi:hypothetical protein